jgi:RNA polymerase sigma-70 factor (ECF subfamily)
MALEDRTRLQSALALLSAEQRAAVVLHDLQGWKAREIAEETGLELATVKSHLRRGRQALVTLLPKRE